MPQAETCNGIDDDCNGMVDEGPICPTVANASGTCVSASCNYACDVDYADCNNNFADGCEVYTPLNCGGCDACPNAPNAVGQCAANACTLICNAGYADCNVNAADGCEVYLFTDVSHCGTCNAPCPSRPNAVPHCNSGNCTYTCVTGYLDCNGNPVDGCEVNITTDADNCGGCGLVCPTGMNCLSGTCQ